MSSTAEPDAVPGVQGERGAAFLNAGRGVDAKLATLRKGAFVGAVVLVSGFVIYNSSAGSGEREDRGSRTTQRANIAYEPAPQAVPPPPAPVTVLGPPAAPIGTPAGLADEEEDKLIRAGRRAPVLAWTRGGRGGPQAGAADPAVTGSVRPAEAHIGLGGYDGGGSNGSSTHLDGLRGGAGRGQPQAVAEREEFTARLQPTRAEGARAGHLGNRDFVIAMGTQIPCALETAMASDQPGFVSCVVTRDVLSDNGRVVLLDRGSQIVGEYRGGLKRGQSRMFVLWNRAKTPTGVIVSLASPGTDALGRAGFAGEIDTHFFERFGAAMLLSVVDDGVGLGVAALQAGNRGGTTNVFVPSASQQGVRSSAAIAVQESVNLPPTLTKNQGESVNVFVARDLDFSGVYRLRVIEGRTQVLDRAATADPSRGAARGPTKP